MQDEPLPQCLLLAQRRRSADCRIANIRPTTADGYRHADIGVAHGESPQGCIVKCHGCRHPQLNSPAAPPCASRRFGSTSTSSGSSRRSRHHEIKRRISDHDLDPASTPTTLPRNAARSRQHIMMYQSFRLLKEGSSAATRYNDIITNFQIMTFTL
jgi:hypothetical protein